MGDIGEVCAKSKVWGRQGCERLPRNRRRMMCGDPDLTQYSDVNNNPLGNFKD